MNTDKLAAILAKLPERAYIDNLDGRYQGGTPVICIQRGESGFYPVHPPLHASGERRLTAAEMNELFEVTPKQAECMLHGSMFGWDTNGADPDYVYSADTGKPFKATPLFLLAAALRAGSQADIWYDAKNYGDHDAQEQIDELQEDIEHAATVLELVDDMADVLRAVLAHRDAKRSEALDDAVFAAADTIMDRFKKVIQ